MTQTEYEMQIAKFEHRRWLAYRAHSRATAALKGAALDSKYLADLARAEKRIAKIARETDAFLAARAAELAAAGRIGYSLSKIDEDEWSWSVERLRAGETIWGSGSDHLAGECAYSKTEAVDGIRAALASVGATLETATRLPF